MYARINASRNLDEGENDPFGFLIEVPFLQQVPLPVQVDLLAEIWMRHSSPIQAEATLLDAAVVYAACMTAARIVSDESSLASTWLGHGARSISPHILKRLPQRLEELFDRWWDDRDFLMIDEFQDLSPEQSQYAKTLLRLPEDMVQPMFDVLERGRVSTKVGRNLEGLLAPEEICAVLSLISKPRHVADKQDELLDGLEDRYHDLLVGPCEREAIDREIQLSFIDEVGVTSIEDFDCTYSDWVGQLREAVRRAKPESQAPEMREDNLSEKVRLAQEAELEDGARIERRNHGWVVVDRVDRLSR